MKQNEKSNKIISNCEDWLNGKYKKNILEGIAKEQKSFFDFVSRLKKIIYKNVNIKDEHYGVHC